MSIDVTGDAARIDSSTSCCSTDDARSHLLRVIRHTGDRSPRRNNAVRVDDLPGHHPLPGSDAWDALAADEQQAVYADYAAINETPGVDTRTAARTARRRAHGARGRRPDRQPHDGAYLGADGAVGGFMVLDADDLDAALAVAARVPAARLGGAIEVRPVARYW